MLASSLDAETQSEYTIQVVVADVELLTATASVTITVVDSNEPPLFTVPEDASEFAFTVQEDASVGTPVGTVSASDPEGNALVFSFAGGNIGSVFAVDQVRAAARRWPKAAALADPLPPLLNLRSLARSGWPLRWTSSRATRINSC